jgi:hypothetical protein
MMSRWRLCVPKVVGAVPGQIGAVALGESAEATGGVEGEGEAIRGGDRFGNRNLAIVGEGDVAAVEGGVKVGARRRPL